MAARPIWEGHLKLSLVACPVALYNATTRVGDIDLHLINPATGNRIRMVPVDPDAGEVERKELVKGFEIESGDHIVLTDDELRSVRLESTRTVDIERFVDADAIDRIWWNDPYYMVPDGKAGADAFIVIREAMRQAGSIAIARLSLHTRERLVAIEPRDRGMLVTTLRSHDEVRDAEELFNDIPQRRADAGMIEIARQIMTQRHGPFDPSEFKDRYEDALRELIARKRDGGGGGSKSRARPRADNVVSLMDALRRSLRQQRPRAATPAPTRATGRKRRAAR
ncbi:MAG: Ku protein [Alphaproteobacteria bacterium]|nr:Ku protein [Alphaproteobacteria bacterium]